MTESALSEKEPASEPDASPGSLSTIRRSAICLLGVVLSLASPPPLSAQESPGSSSGEADESSVRKEIRRVFKITDVIKKISDADARMVSIWGPLTSFRPSLELQEEILKRGPDWKVQRIEDGVSYLNIDYYSVLVERLPYEGGREISADILFERFKQSLVDPERKSNNRVRFTPVEGASLARSGSLFKLEFTPYSFASCKNLKSCVNISWLQDDAVCSKLDDYALKFSDRSMDNGYIVVCFSAPQELRVATVQGGSRIGAAFSSGNAGTHPVSGNRAFGYSKTSSGLVFYTIGSDRLCKLESELGLEYLLFPRLWLAGRATEELTETKMEEIGAVYGFCAAEVFWSVFFTEFAEWVNYRKGKATVRVPDRRIVDWSVANVTLFDTKRHGAPDWLVARRRHVSVVDYLKLNNQPSGAASRAEHFRRLLPNERYGGGAEQNVKLLEKLIQDGNLVAIPFPSQNIEGCNAFYSNNEISRYVSEAFAGNAVKACRVTGSDAPESRIREELQRLYRTSIPADGILFTAAEHKNIHDEAYKAAGCRETSANIVGWLIVDAKEWPSVAIQLSIDLFGKCTVPDQ